MFCLVAQFDVTSSRTCLYIHDVNSRYNKTANCDKIGPDVYNGSFNNYHNQIIIFPLPCHIPR